MRLTSLPPELFLYLFSHMPLKSLIVARTVCRLWREATVKAPIPDARRKLLDFYYRLIETPYFAASRSVHDEAIKTMDPFNREEYLECFCEYIDDDESRVISLPDEFTTWILEWPTNAVFGGMWPYINNRPFLVQDDQVRVLHFGEFTRFNDYCLGECCLWGEEIVSIKIDFERRRQKPLEGENGAEDQQNADSGLKQGKSIVEEANAVLLWEVNTSDRVSSYYLVVDGKHRGQVLEEEDIKYQSIWSSEEPMSYRMSVCSIGWLDFMERTVVQTCVDAMERRAEERAEEREFSEQG